MGQPKRKQSKRRSGLRRGANSSTKRRLGYSQPNLVQDPTDGSWVKSHHVNPDTGMYRGRQVLDVTL
ncbi:MAG: 50S ribosomal protein L32 [Opitutales bacterium]|nr:50S ribosomal protein L32 [Opitutales bacterium]